MGIPAVQDGRGEDVTVPFIPSVLLPRKNPGYRSALMCLLLLREGYRDCISLLLKNLHLAASLFLDTIQRISSSNKALNCLVLQILPTFILSSLTLCAPIPYKDEVGSN